MMVNDERGVEKVRKEEGGLTIRLFGLDRTFA